MFHAVRVFGTAAFIFGALLGFALWFGGYERAILINKSLRITSATVVNERNVASSCCHYVCTGGKHTCTSQCRNCYDHYVTFRVVGDASIVVDAEPQDHELFVWKDYGPTQNYYVEGTNYTMYYNICPLIPRMHDDQVICDAHHDKTPFYFIPLEAVVMKVIAIICFSIGSLGLLSLFMAGVWLTYEWMAGQLTIIWMYKRPPEYEDPFVHTKEFITEDSV